MDNSKLYVGLDIGTTSIKVIVAEKIRDQLNVIGVGNERSEGLSGGIIVDIDKAARSIRNAVSQAEEKSGIKIDKVVVGVPAEKLSIDHSNGRITTSNKSREINEEDVEKVANSILHNNLPPEREVINISPEEFVVDGFDGIEDPRGMVGMRLEMKGRLITAPTTIIHNIKSAVGKAGLKIDALAVDPLAEGNFLLNDAEQEFGTTVIDLGGGQTTAAVVHDHKLKFVTVDKEGGQYISKDISNVLNTSLKNSEKLKRDYGFADSVLASSENEFPVEVVGKSKPVQFSEKLLAEIIQARLEQIFTRLKERLDTVNALQLPGGIVLTGGVAAIPGVAELAADTFNANVKVDVPDQMGLRHPSFGLPLSLVDYRTKTSPLNKLVNASINGSEIKNDGSNNFEENFVDQSTDNLSYQSSGTQRVSNKSFIGRKKDKKDKRWTKDNIKNFFMGFFD